MKWKDLVQELERMDYSRGYGYLEIKYVVLASQLIIPAFDWKRTDLNEIVLTVNLHVRLNQIRQVVTRDQIKVTGVDRT